MKNKTFTKYYIFSIIGVFIASFYPLYMGARVVFDMIKDGTVLGENYPKYIIPYTPISLAVIIGVLLLPLAFKLAKRFALLAGSCVSFIIFFLAELLLENKVIVTDTVVTTLESWQMYMCYIPREGITRALTAIEVLIGEYSPAFKIHFYIIAVVLILSLLNCFYGFAQMILSGSRQRLKSLIMQAVSSILFLGLCIWACFTAFYRTGELQVSAVSAVLMSIFFIVFGLTMGIYVGSFLLGKNKWLSVAVPSATASLVTIVMYIGEMILLDHHLYRFGTGFFFEGLGGLVLAPIDLLIILLSGGICALISRAGS